jgi:hypothetical protein
MNPYDTNLIHSFYDQVTRGLGFTEKQATLSVKILKRQIPKLNLIFNQDISTFLENPQFRLSRRTVASAKKMTIQPHEIYGKVIKVEFPFNEAVLAKVRKEKMSLNYANWDPEKKSWIFSLDERSLKFLIGLAVEENFSVDEEFEDYQSQFTDIERNIEQYVPMLSLDGEKLKFLNISPKIPQPTNSNILENLFLARKLGIFTWDEQIVDSDEWKNANSVTRQFLSIAPNEEFSINVEDTAISSLSDIVNYLSPTLFVIPGGTELEKLEKCITFLNDNGITNDEISVLFRLPKETGEKFNNFVKDENLNSPITEKTKAVFISSKVPKTILESRIKFNLIVNFNFYSIHYSIKNLLKWHHNVITIVEQKQQKAFNFGKL